MTLTGTIAAKEDGVVSVDIVGRNEIGNHVTGRVDLKLPVENAA